MNGINHSSTGIPAISASITMAPCGRRGPRGPGGRPGVRTSGAPQGPIGWGELRFRAGERFPRLGPARDGRVPSPHQTKGGPRPGGRSRAGGRRVLVLGQLRRWWRAGAPGEGDAAERGHEAGGAPDCESGARAGCGDDPADRWAADRRRWRTSGARTRPAGASRPPSRQVPGEPLDDRQGIAGRTAIVVPGPLNEPARVPASPACAGNSGCPPSGAACLDLGVAGVRAAIGDHVPDHAGRQPGRHRCPT